MEMSLSLCLFFVLLIFASRSFVCNLWRWREHFSNVSYELINVCSLLSVAHYSRRLYSMRDKEDESYMTFSSRFFPVCDDRCLFGCCQTLCVGLSALQLKYVVENGKMGSCHSPLFGYGRASCIVFVIVRLLGEPIASLVSQRWHGEHRNSWRHNNVSIFVLSFKWTFNKWLLLSFRLSIPMRLIPSGRECRENECMCVARYREGWIKKVNFERESIHSVSEWKANSNGLSAWTIEERVLISSANTFWRWIESFEYLYFCRIESNLVETAYTFAWNSLLLFPWERMSGNTDDTERDDVVAVTEGAPSDATESQERSRVESHKRTSMAEIETLSAEELAAYEHRDVVAEWHVPLHGKFHKIEFEHGTTSGRRVLWVDKRVRR